MNKTNFLKQLEQSKCPDDDFQVLKDMHLCLIEMYQKDTITIEEKFSLCEYEYIADCAYNHYNKLIAYKSVVCDELVIIYGLITILKKKEVK